MIKGLKGFFLFSLLLILSNSTFAQSIENSFNNMGPYTIGGLVINPSFTPSITDLSISYLGQIFGTVGTVLHGTSGQLLGSIFKVFNIGLLVVAGIFLIYTIVMTVLNAAHEGEFMGRKWNSAWIAIRTVLGLGLLVPSATTGYSTVQIIVMWVIIQGVGFANMAWDSALNYLGTTGQIYTPPSTDTGTMLDLVGTVLEMQVCMYAAQNVESTLQKNLKENEQNQQQQGTNNNTNTAAPTIPGVTYVQNFTPLFLVFKDSTQSGLYNSVVKFPGNKYETDGQQDNACGQISFGTNKDQTALQNDNKVSTLQAAVKQIMLDTDSYAKQIVNGGGGSNSNFVTQVQSAIVGGAADWINITLPIRTTAGGGGAINQVIHAMMEKFFKSAVEQGWIMAGMYYYSLGNLQSQVTAATSVSVKIDAPPAGFPQSSSYISFTGPVNPSENNMNGNPSVNQPGLLDFSANDKHYLAAYEKNAGLYVTSSKTAAKQLDQTNKFQVKTEDAGILTPLFSPWASIVYDALNSFAARKGDPIMIIRHVGDKFMDKAIGLWVSGILIIFTIATATGVVPSLNPLPFSVEDAVIAYIPVMTAFILILFMLGSTMYYYIPLIPFIIFSFSAVGWLVAVIEAMVAAPLVALGVTHPEGHDLLGKSEQATMFLLSIFLRPVLMITGLIAGMMLSRVALSYINLGFFNLVGDLTSMSSFSFISLLGVYTMLIMTVVNQSFSLIYGVPDRVMRWLGVNEQTTGVQEALQSTKHGLEQVSSSGERFMGGTSSTATTVGEKSIKRSREADQKDEDVTGGGNP